MAKGSIEVLKGKIDVHKVVELLNAALAEEWLAFYQYWIGALVVRGTERGEIQKEFQDHALEEFGHAELIAARIIELDGTPILDPQKWFEVAKCKYSAPDKIDTGSLLTQNIIAERCAIKRYMEIASFTNGIDFTTCDLAKSIMKDEEEHEQDLQDFIDDFTQMK